MRRASHKLKGNTLDEAVALYQAKKNNVAKAIAYLIEKQFLANTPQDIASFLRIYKQKFDSTAIGEYVFCYTIVLPPFLVCERCLCLSLSIYYCLSAFSDTT